MLITTEKSSGFTLLEILISLAIMTVIMGAVYVSFFSVLRAVERFDGTSVKYHDARRLLDIMRREIESSFIKIPKAGDKTTPRASFIIKDRDIQGKAASQLELATHSRRGGTSRVFYFAEMQDESLVLYRTETAAIFPSGSVKVQVLEELINFSIEVSFNNKWVGTWDAAGTGTLPEAVRITVEFNDSGKTIKLKEYAVPRTGTKLKDA
ncbi:MAG: prepilin-type N-terminal cleavage/methylation domain-containing protein [Nitrospira sp.]|nr:prepilin-type N-terminal cleavage/methylation domain-containing protein [Nitrospira sp.]